MMTAPDRRPLAEALAAAERVVAMLRSGCERIEIAGSIRRNARHVKDIEIVCVPRHQPDLFGGAGQDMLNQQIRTCVRSRKLQWRDLQRERFGAPEPKDLDERRYYALATVEPRPWLPIKPRPGPIDLFAVRRPAQGGAIMAIRPGPAVYARELVTEARRRGLRCENGRLVSLDDGAELATPEERAFIEACGMQYLDPHERKGP
jgi:DNA polymerase/3'-5' exonuclease PolX